MGLSLTSRSSFESSFVKRLLTSDAPSKCAIELLLDLEAAAAAEVDLGGCGCWFEKLRTMSASVAGVLAPDHSPPDGDAAPLVALCANLELDPELIVRRTPPSELFQFLYGSPSEKGESSGLLVVDDPVNLRRYSNDGLAVMAGDDVCVCADGGFEGSTPGRRWSTEAESFIS